MLVVDQGTTVKLDVHNELPDNLSLAVPGIPAADLGSGFDGRRFARLVETCTRPDAPGVRGRLIPFPRRNL